MADSHTLAAGATTQSSPSQKGVYWRFIQNAQPPFDPSVFSEDALRTKGRITGVAGAGRGNTFFLTLADTPLVLRHYRRGGLARKISTSKYCYTGLANTRAIREFDLLCELYDQSLPVPKPYAAQVVVSGLRYEASIVTYKLAGNTLAECLQAGESVSSDQWKAIGETIAQFHKQGVYHADLNAHNVMLGEGLDVTLIDFDRARIKALPSVVTDGWCKANIDRLKRSLDKIVKEASMDSTSNASDSVLLKDRVTEGYECLEKSWNACLAG